MVSGMKTREVTLTIGVFFDGTGNNAVNTLNMLKYITNHYNINSPDAESILTKCAYEYFGVSGLCATSYTGYYTNIHWLRTLYSHRFIADTSTVQQSLYIDGIGTEADKPDSKMGLGFGISDTGIIAKTDKAISMLPICIQDALRTASKQLSDNILIIKTLQFDIFGFSRGAAAARHFANRILYEDPAIISVVRQFLTGISVNDSPLIKSRFIGIFDTVTAIGIPNVRNRHIADTSDVKLTLHPEIAESVFHITAANECRFNFALNSVKNAWPELALPGVHSDIGGGYLPLTRENLFLTRPLTETVPYDLPDEKTWSYRQTTGQLQMLNQSPCLSPLLRTNVISAETWYDDRAPLDRYGQLQKRSYTALAIRDRTVRNEWSRVALRVMIEAAKEAGVVLEPIGPSDLNMKLPDELAPLCEKALAMGYAVRNGQVAKAYSQDELDIITEKYVHCSANWNAIRFNSGGFIQGGASPSELLGFINRPDEHWKRTIYDIDGLKI